MSGSRKSGSADEIALLYVSMARAAGLKVWPAYLVNRNRAIFDMSYLSNSQFDDDIAIVELNGKSVFLDPGQKCVPSAICSGSTPGPPGSGSRRKAQSLRPLPESHTRNRR